MRKTIAQETSFYESLSDIAMATLGIFVIFFVINLVFINSDVIEQAVRNTHLDKAINQSSIELEDFKAEEKRQIENFKVQNEQKIKKMETEIIEIRAQSNMYEEKIADSKERIKKEMNVDEVITVKEVRKILQQLKLTNKTVENELKDIRLKINHIKQEFSIFKEVPNSLPYLEIGIKGSDITLNYLTISEKQFRGILQGINAGSGFAFRMKKEVIDGKYVRPPTPFWLNKIIASEGKLPIIDDFY